MLHFMCRTNCAQNGKSLLQSSPHTLNPEKFIPNNDNLNPKQQNPPTIKPSGPGSFAEYAGRTRTPRQIASQISREDAENQALRVEEDLEAQNLYASRGSQKSGVGSVVRSAADVGGGVRTRSCVPSQVCGWDSCVRV